jgi:hypothetical protein
MLESLLQREDRERGGWREREKRNRKREREIERE